MEKEENSKKSSISKKRLSTVSGIVILVLLALFVLGFHIITYSDGVTFIPKKNLSLADTFLSIDEVLDRYNNCNPFARDSEVCLGYVVKKLKEKGIVVKKE